MDTHELKTDPEPFKDIFEGRKKATIRKLDRDFKVGDVLIFKRTSNGEETGERLITTITHIQKGYGLPDEYGVLSFQRERY